ncbi:MAG: dihydroorotase [Aeromonas sp.]
MKKLLIKAAKVVNEGTIYTRDVLIADERIVCIAPAITPQDDETQVIDAAGRYLLPGMIDDQVHFREPGLTHKGTIASESRAAAAGGTTSFMEMPNVNPATTTLEALEAKFALAANNSAANYSFYLGATNDNLSEIQRLDPAQCCGVKVFMGSSTGNMLVDNPATLSAIFATSPVLIVTHCEDTPTIAANEAAARAAFGDDVPMREHGRIRSRAACLKSTQLAVDLAKEHHARLHVLHISTHDELALFTPSQTLAELAQKRITAEVCVHHLYFNEADYARLGSQIKCNPAIKTSDDQLALQAALREGRLDVIATDHAPHTWAEKQNSYFNAPSGVPLVQHSLQALLELYQHGVLSLELIAQKTAHAVATRFGVVDRGFIREGYFADLVLVDLDATTLVREENTFYHCGWSPFTGHTFASRIDLTLVNGQIVWQDGQFVAQNAGKRLNFAH